MDLLQRCEKLLRDRKPDPSDKKTFHHPVIVLADEASTDLQVGLKQHFQRLLKYPDSVAFLSLDNGELTFDSFEETRVQLVQMEDGKRRSIFRDCATLDFHCIISATNPNWQQLMESISKLQNRKNLSITLFWYLLLDDSLDYREDSEQIVERIQGICTTHISNILTKHSVFLLSNALLNAAMLSPQRRLDEDAAALSAIILLSGIAEDTDTSRGVLLQCQYKTIAMQLLELPLGEIAAVTLHRIIERIFEVDVDEESAEAVLRDALGLKHGKCSLLDSVLQSLALPEGEDLIKLPHRQDGWKTLKKQPQWDHELLQNCTLGCWGLHLDACKQLIDRQVDVEAIKRAFRKMLLKEQAANAFVFSKGLSSSLREEILGFASSIDALYSGAKKAKLEQRLSSFFTSWRKQIVFEIMVPLLIDVIDDMQAESIAWIASLRGYTQEIEQSDLYEDACQASSGIEAVYTEAVNGVAEADVAFYQLRQVASESLLFDVYSEIVTRTPQYSLAFDEEFYARYQAHQDTLNKSNFLYKQLMEDIVKLSRLRTEATPSVLLECFLGELSPELVSQLKDADNRKVFLPIDKLNALERVVVCQLDSPIHLL